MTQPRSEKTFFSTKTLLLFGVGTVGSQNRIAKGANVAILHASMAGGRWLEGGM